MTYIHELSGFGMRRSIRVAIDLTALLPEATGVDNYLKHLVLYLGRIDDKNQYRIL
jgi:hypothetical protein